MVDGKRLCHNDTHFSKYKHLYSALLIQKAVPDKYILIIDSRCDITWIFAETTVLNNRTQKTCRIL
jgi:hypothetical protein